MRSISRSFTSIVKPEIAEKFRNMAMKLDKRPAQLIREFIIAAVEKRMKISPKKVDTEVHNNIYN